MGVSGAQTGLDVAHRDAPVEPGQGGRQGRGGVALDEDEIRHLLGQERVQRGEYPRADVARRLVLGHDGKIVIDADLEQAHEWVEQLPVLARGDVEGREGVGAGLELLDDRRQLDDFGPGAEDGHDLLAGHGVTAPRPGRRRGRPTSRSARSTSS